MANNSPLQTRRMGAPDPAKLEALAADALGGPPARPPGLPMRQLPQVDQAARAAFQQRMAAEEAAAAGAVAPRQALGSPLFDTPPAVAARAEAVAVLRDRLGKLATQILKDHAELLPLIERLGEEQTDGFDPGLGKHFLLQLKSALDCHLEVSTPEPEPEPEAPAAAAPKKNLTDLSDPTDPTDPVPPADPDAAL